MNLALRLVFPRALSNRNDLERYKEISSRKLRVKYNDPSNLIVTEKYL
jgi:hypothetical protein